MHRNSGHGFTKNYRNWGRSMLELQRPYYFGSVLLLSHSLNNRKLSFCSKVLFSPSARLSPLFSANQSRRRLQTLPTNHDKAFLSADCNDVIILQETLRSYVCSK